MKESEDKHVEKLIDRLMKEVSVETPSLDFTAKVMSEVLVTKKTPVFTYKPLLSKWFWLVLFCGVTATLCVAFWSGDIGTGKGYGLELMRMVDSKILSFESGIKFSKVSMYAVIVLVLMLFVKISMLKNRYDKELNL